MTRPGADQDDRVPVDPRVEHTRTQVHQAVLSLLQDEGLRAVTHARVAARAPVSRATIYRHFPDRAALLASSLRALRPDVEVPDPVGEPLADARALLTVIAGHLNDNEMLVDMLTLLRDADHDPDLAVARQHVLPQEANPVARLVEAGLRSGRIRADVDPLVAAATLMGPMLGLRVLLRVQLTDELVEGIAQVWARGVSAD